MAQKLPEIFDRDLLKSRLKRAAPRFADHDFLHVKIIEDIVDRLETVQRQFEQTVILGPGAQLLRPRLTPACNVGTLQECGLYPQGPSAMFADEEKLPFAPNSLDLIISIMGLHTVNDLPGALIQMRRALKPDGLVIAAMPAEQTLHELKTVLYQAETEITGGVSPRVFPFAAIKDLGGLLQRAGLALPVADVLSYPVIYRKPTRLFQDLRGMGETNILRARRKTGLGRKILARALELYTEHFPADGGGIQATFEIVMLTGWAPHESQQKPLQPGSGKVSLKDAIQTTEQSS